MARPRSVEEAADQFSLSALDGAACELQVTRERLALALVTEETREQFAAEHGIGDEELEAAVRAGLVRAIDDAERAGALPGFVAAPLRLAARQVPAEEAIALILDAEEIFGRGRDLRLEGLLRKLEASRCPVPPRPPLSASVPRPISHRRLGGLTR